MSHRRPCKAQRLAPTPEAAGLLLNPDAALVSSFTGMNPGPYHVRMEHRRALLVVQLSKPQQS